MKIHAAAEIFADTTKDKSRETRERENILPKVHFLRWHVLVSCFSRFYVLSPIFGSLVLDNIYRALDFEKLKIKRNTPGNNKSGRSPHNHSSAAVINSRSRENPIRELRWKAVAYASPIIRRLYTRVARNLHFMMFLARDWYRSGPPGCRGI